MYHSIGLKVKLMSGKYHHIGGSGPPCNTWFLGPTQVLNPNAISIGAAVFAGLTSVTDRQTDRQTTLLG